jgi:hypothetical protein
MTRLPLFRLTLLGAALLGANPLSAQRPPTRVRAVLPAYRVPIALDTIMQRTTHEASPGQVWTAAAKVFYDLKIATDTRDSAAGVIGVVKYTKSGYLADQPMSRLLNCGIDMVGQKADIYRISLVLMAIVTPLTATKTELGVGFVGSGIDVRGSSGDPVACAPTGRMESMFAERVTKALKGPEEPPLRKPPQ